MIWHVSCDLTFSGQIEKSRALSVDHILNDRARPSVKCSETSLPRTFFNKSLTKTFRISGRNSEIGSGCETALFYNVPGTGAASQVVAPGGQCKSDERNLAVRSFR
jgi:hypothetical protein